MSISKPLYTDGDVTVAVSFTITNTGSLSGSQVIQVYTSLPPTFELTHPSLQLKAFAKVRDLAPGKSESVDIKLDKYAVSYWDDKINSWVVEKGNYGVMVGLSSEDLGLSSQVILDKGFEWNGL